MKFFKRSSAESSPSLRPRMSIPRSIAYDASVTRNEQRYATPPGALFVKYASSSVNAIGKSYEPVQMPNNPAGYFVGSAAASKAP